MNRITGDKPSRCGGEKTSRSMGEAPGIGRVPRSPQSGTSGKNGTGFTSGQRLRRQKLVKAWSLVLAVASAGIVLIFVFSKVAKNSGSKSKSEVATERAPNLDQIFAEDPNPKNQSPGEVASLELVAAALSNRSPGKITDFFKLPSETTPEEAVGILEKLRRAGRTCDRYEMDRPSVHKRDLGRKSGGQHHKERPQAESCRPSGSSIRRRLAH